MIETYRSTFQSDWFKDKIKKARRKHNRIMHLTKTEHFRSILHFVAVNFSLMWKLAKWEHTSSLTSLTHSVVSSLKISKTNLHDFNLNWNLIKDFEDKVKVLQQQFFSERSETDLFNLNTTIYSQKIENNKLISEKKIQQVIIKLCLNKISEKTNIINNFLKLISEFLICVITCFIQDCQYWKYFLKIFKIIWTIIIQKTDKKSY